MHHLPCNLKGEKVHAANMSVYCLHDFSVWPVWQSLKGQLTTAVVEWQCLTPVCVADYCVGMRLPTGTPTGTSTCVVTDAVLTCCHLERSFWEQSQHDQVAPCRLLLLAAESLHQGAFACRVSGCYPDVDKINFMIHNKCRSHKKRYTIHDGRVTSCSMKKNAVQQQCGMIASDVSVPGGDVVLMM